MPRACEDFMKDGDGALYVETIPRQIFCEPKRMTDGAGEAIRTPDPNLGKVMLYP